MCILIRILTISHCSIHTINWICFNLMLIEWWSFNIFNQWTNNALEETFDMFVVDPRPSKICEDDFSAILTWRNVDASWSKMSLIQLLVHICEGNMGLVSEFGPFVTCCTHETYLVQFMVSKSCSSLLEIDLVVSFRYPCDKSLSNGFNKSFILGPCNCCVYMLSSRPLIKA